MLLLELSLKFFYLIRLLVDCCKQNLKPEVDLPMSKLGMWLATHFCFVTKQSFLRCVSSKHRAFLWQLSDAIYLRFNDTYLCVFNNLYVLPKITGERLLNWMNHWQYIFLKFPVFPTGFSRYDLWFFCPRIFHSRFHPKKS